MTPGRGRTMGPAWRWAKTAAFLLCWSAAATAAAADAQAPYLNIIAPGHGDTVSGTVRVAVEGSDDVGVAGVQFTLDGSPLGPRGTALPFVFFWDTRLTPNGNYDLQVDGWDAAGNLGHSIHTVPLTIANTGTPPLVGDINNDGEVGIADLSRLLALWGATDAGADIDASGRIDLADLSRLLSHWGERRL